MDSLVGSASPAPSRWSRALAALRFRSACIDPLTIVALLALFLLAHRHLDGLDVGGDAVTKWQFVRQWHYANDFEHAVWDHHMARMGVNAVTWLVQLLFGRNWRAYYVGPMFMVLAQLPLAYLLARRFGGRSAGILACFAITFLPSIQLTVSQLLPDGFVATYALLTTYSLVRWAEAREKHRLPWLLAAGFAAFVGYLAKETFCFFYPGFGLAILLTRRRLRDALVFVGMLVALLGLETLCYRAFTQYSSRLAIVRSTHFAGGGDSEPVSFQLAGFLEMFKNLDREWHWLLALGAMGAAWLLLTPRRRKQSTIVVLAGASHVALLGLSTQLWQRPLPRYLDPAVPFVAIGAGVTLAAAAEALLGSLRRVPRVDAVVARLHIGWGLRLAGALLTIAIAAGLTYRHQLAHPILDGFEHGARVARIANNTYERNLPLVYGHTPAKVLMAFYNVYLSDRRLARDGILPDFAGARRRVRRTWYLVKDPGRYTPGVFEQLSDAGCVVEVRRGPKSRGMKGCADIPRRDMLPARCDEMLRSLTQVTSSQ